MTQPPPPPPPPKKRSSTALFIGALLVIIAIAGIIAYVYVTFINIPKPEIMLVDGHEGFQGLNYVFYVDVTVKNNGANGVIKVYAEISGAGRYEQQDKNVYVAAGDTGSLQFTFDISLWGSLTNPSITYRAWANAD